ncbi:MAG: hypothetical protein WCJ29_04640 [bacterium]
MKREGGFTTLELVIALGVVFIITAISIMMVRSARSQMRDAVRVSDIKQIQAGLELFFAEQYSYPVVTDVVVVGGPSTICLDKQGFSASCSSDRPYMPTVPGSIDSSAYVYISRNNENVACVASPCAKYAMQFTLENARGTLAEGLNCARPEGIKPGACQ